ncbi:MAG: hypothetical protein HY855_25595 [Burkholderiales bacterium]|nr:hypothetical protein [Burkholderiales bacterium]
MSDSSAGVASKRWPALGWLVAGLVLGSAAAQAQTLTLGARSGNTVQPLLGLNIGPGPQGEAGNADLTSAYQQRGVTLVRTHDYYGPLDMATLYPNRSKDPLLQSSYNFTGVLDATYQRSSDSVFAAILAGGFEPYVRIGDSFNNVTPPSSTELANWVQATVQVLKHYRSGQWNGFTSSFRFAEIWNEPDNADFWPSTRSTEEFNTLFEQTAKALRSAFPSLKVGGPGFSPGGCLSPTGQAKTRSLLDHVKANAVPMDFLSFHVYGTDAATYLSCAQFYRSELDSRGLNAVELHITEWNTPNGSAGSTTGQLRYNAQGAAYMTAAWINLQNGGVKQSTFYRGTDPTPTFAEFYGMFYGDGRAKKVADAFSLWRDLSAYPRVLQTTGAPTGTTVLAAEDDGGARAVLVANPQATATSVNLALADGKSLSDYRVLVSSVTDAASGIASSVLTGSSLAVPAKASLLLRLTPKNAAFGTSATTTGPATARTVTLHATLAAADVGSAGSIHVAALVGGTFYAYNGRQWSAWAGGELPAAFKGNLPPAFSITPLSAVDLTGLSGTPIYIGYGTSVDDMLRNARYRPAYVVP